MSESLRDAPTTASDGDAEERAGPTCPIDPRDGVPDCSVGPFGRLIWLVRDVATELRRWWRTRTH
ncbi:MAG: hypothetical protein PVSMB4_19710 [Ktedonobacterales bacterium]